MKHRIVWPVVAALGLGALVLFLSQSPAQRPGGRLLGGGPGGAGPGAGRFVVAHASATQVLVLDTATGQVYRAGAEDFKKASQLPGAGEDVAPEPPGRDRERVREKIRRRIDKELPPRDPQPREDRAPPPPREDKAPPPPPPDDRAPPPPGEREEEPRQ